MSGKIEYELSAHAATVMVEREIPENPFRRVVANVAPGAIVCFAAG